MDANKSKEREEYKEKMYQYRIRGQIDLSIFMNCKKIVKKLKNYADTMPHGRVLCIHGISQGFRRTKGGE